MTLWKFEKTHNKSLEEMSLIWPYPVFYLITLQEIFISLVMLFILLEHIFES